MAKALKIVGAVAVIAGLAIVTGGAAVGLGLSLSINVAGITAGAAIAAGSILSTAGSLLSAKPKAPSVSSATADRLQVSIDLRTPRKMIWGTTAAATDLRDQEFLADQSVVHRFIVNASHRLSAYREIWFDDKLAWTAAGGVQGEFSGYLTVVPVTEGSAANAINLGPRMGAARRYTGCAYVYLRFKTTGNSKKVESPFAASIPTRVTIIVDGAPVYDPRLDGSVEGGSGPQRADDQVSWAWSDGAARNPALQLLWYLLGWRIRNPSTGAMKLAAGKGLPAARIDLQSFITAANLCDEPVARADGTTEPRYRSDGIASEGDDTATVLDQLKAAMNAVLDDVDGRIRLTILHNDLAAPIGELGAADLIGDYDWVQTPPLTDSVNVIRGAYVDPTPRSLFQMVDYPEVRIDSPDGIDRPQTVNLSFVQSASQAQRLVKQRLQRAQYGGSFTGVFQATAWKFQKGDVIRFSFYPLGWDRKLFRIADMAIQVDGLVPMMLREEHPDIYAWDASDAAPVHAADPTVYDPTLWPIVQGIGEAGRTAEWPEILDPDGTKPDPNATNSADPDSPFGPGETVGGAIDRIDAAKQISDAAKARVDTLENDTIPAIDGAITAANDRITTARAAVDGRIDATNLTLGHARDDLDAEINRAVGADEQLGQRIDAIAADGGYDDTQVRSLITSEETVRADSDRALGQRVDNAITGYQNADTQTNTRIGQTETALSDATISIGGRIDGIETDYKGKDSATNTRITNAVTALSDADRALGQRIDSVAADGGYDDTSLRAEVTRVDQAAIERDGSLAGRAELLEASYGTDSGLTPNGTFEKGVQGWVLSGGVAWIASTPEFTGVVRATGVGGTATGPRTVIQRGKAYRLRTGFVSRGYRMIHYAGLSCYAIDGGYLGNIYLPGVSGEEQPYDAIYKNGVFSGEINYGPAPVFVGSATAFPTGTHTVTPLFLLNYEIANASGPVQCDLDHLYLENATDFVAADARITDTANTLAQADQSLADRASTVEASLNTPGIGALARLGNAETALSDGRFATALRAANIEVSVADVSGRLSTVETATTDGRFVSTSRVQTLESDYYGTKATVSQQAGTITGLGQRTAAYVRLLTVAGNNRAQLTLSADANGGAGADLVGDLAISGNLFVGGSIVTAKIAPGAITNTVTSYVPSTLNAPGDRPSDQWLTVVAASLNSLGGTAILITPSAVYNGLGLASDSGYSLLARLLRDGVLIWGPASLPGSVVQSASYPAESVPVRQSTGVIGFNTVDAPGAGIHTYELQFAATSSADSFSVSNRTIALTELKR